MEYWGRNEGHVLASTCPELAEQWNYDKNGALTPWDVTIGSNKKVWWKCALGHEWETEVKYRAIKSTGCPYCSGNKVWPGFNDLATIRPDAAADWDYNLNGNQWPVQYGAFSGKKVWWVCRRGHPSYLMAIYNRSAGWGCPKCRLEKIAAFHSKKVFYYAPDGRLHGAYPSIKAAARETGRDRSTVRKLSAGKKPARNGYLYRFADQQPVNDPSPTVEGMFRDCLSQPVSVGDSVMFIRWGETRMPKLIRGRVAKVAESCVYIQPENGNLVRQLVSKDDPEFLPRLLVLRPRPERALEGELEASGYPVREGDPVVYMLPLVYMNSKELLFGTAHRTADSFWLVDGAKVPTSRMVVANWE